MPSAKPSSVAALLGACLALPIGLAALLSVGLILRVAVGPGPSFAKVLHGFRQSVTFLLAAGAVSGLMYFRETLPTGASARARRFLAFTYVALPLAFVFAMAFRSLQYAQFWFSVMRPQFDATFTEEQVRARLGPPTSELRGSAELRMLMFSPCSPERTTHALMYSAPGGGTYRVLCFDAAGHYTCDDTGHIW